MSLSVADVQKQINQMMAFIEQEANEKAEEIDAKAEEEFNIEKGRLVQQQRLKLMEHFEKKEKEIELRRKIHSSNMLNQARLELLKVREGHVEQLLEKCRSCLSTVTKNEDHYSVLLKNLILYGLYQLLESNVTLRIRRQDQSIIERALPSILIDYKEKTGKDVTLKIDKDQYLGNEVKGGVELLALNGRIKIDNTLEARLEHIAQQLLPEIRCALFGVNPNRKFKH